MSVFCSVFAKAKCLRVKHRRCLCSFLGVPWLCQEGEAEALFSFSLCLGSAELVGQRRRRPNDFVTRIIVTQVTGIFVVVVVIYLTLRACLVQPAS